MRVELMAHSGDDLLVVNAARCSFGKEVNEFTDKDEKLINFLAREKHLLPFRHPAITLRCSAELPVARQLGKHQTGMSWSEESRRYITSLPQTVVPALRARAANVKQGSEEYLVEDYEALSEDIEELQQQCVSMYVNLLAKGVAPEVARYVLPQGTEITWVWTGTLLAWVHMYKERTHPTAQKETEAFAEKVREIIEPLYPVSWKALVGEVNG